MNQQQRDAARSVYRDDPIGRPFFELTRSAHAAEAETEVKVAAGRLSVEEWHLKDFFRRLEALGFGKYVVGRHGYDCRLRWSLPLADVAEAAVGANMQEGRMHTFALRPGLSVAIPADLTAKEADRLANWIRAAAA